MKIIELNNFKKYKRIIKRFRITSIKKIIYKPNFISLEIEVEGKVIKNYGKNMKELYKKSLKELKNFDKENTISKF